MDDALEKAVEAVGETVADEALGPDEGDDPLSHIMSDMPGPLRFMFKMSVGLLAGAPVFAMTKLARKLQQRPKRRRPRHP